MIEITPEELHVWYLEATEQLKGKEMHFNPKAQKPYSDLTDEQKSIDKHIALQINRKIWHGK